MSISNPRFLYILHILRLNIPQETLSHAPLIIGQRDVGIISLLHRRVGIIHINEWSRCIEVVPVQ